MDSKKSGKRMAAAGLSVFLLVAADQLTKWAAYRYLRGTNGISLVPGVFELRYLENTSAAFSFDPVSLLQKIFRFSYFEEHPDAFLAAKMAFFIVLTLAVLLFLVFLYRRIPTTRRFLPLNLAVIGIFAGALGNLLDRMARSFVIDFFSFSLIRFPVFNVADIYVTLSVIAFVVLLLFVYKENELTGLFRKT